MQKLFYRKFIFTFYIIFISFSSFGQKNSFKLILRDYFDKLIKLEYIESKKSLINLKDSLIKKDLIELSDLLYNNGQNLKKNNFVKVINTDSNFRKSIYLLTKAYHSLYFRKNEKQVFSFFFNAYSESKKTNNIDLIRFSILSILEYYQYEYALLNNQFKLYLDEYNSISYTPIERFRGSILGSYFEMKKINPNEELIEKNITNLDYLYNELKGLNIKLFALYFGIKAVQNEVKSNPKKSTKFHNKVLSLIKKEPYLKYLKFRTFIRFSSIKYKNNNFNESLIFLDSAKNYIDISYPEKSYIYINDLISKNYYKLEKYDKAYTFLRKVKEKEYFINYRDNSIKTSEIETIAKTQETKKENLSLKKENQKQLIWSLILAFFTITISLLIIKNSRKKRLIALQERKIEEQKNLTLLKEQELTTINAMVDGQEKERKRIAEDLHDNLGSVLATLKLHFENLKINRAKKKINQEELFDKTENLIDEAYLKVRRIAHAKNAGVIANQGLLVAVQMMAEKISSADKIKIDVIDFGLNKRIENTIEISVFRIIQELITNTIKHSEAKNATINIAAYDNNLNIIIEDNGKGFDIDKVNLKDGMGISSIKTRIAHLKGNFTVDSTLGKGSSVIINIPIS